MYRHDWRLLRLAGRNGPDLMPPEVLGEPIADAIGSARAHSRSNFPQQVRLLRHSDGLRFGYQIVRFHPLARLSRRWIARPCSGESSSDSPLEGGGFELTVPARKILWPAIWFPRTAPPARRNCLERDEKFESDFLRQRFNTLAASRTEAGSDVGLSMQTFPSPTSEALRSLLRSPINSSTGPGNASY